MSLTLRVAGTGRVRGPRLFWLVTLTALPVVLVYSLSVGRYDIPLADVGGVLLSRLIPIDPFWTVTEGRVVELIRMPRILAACIVGAALAIAGAALQGVFRNPLVGPQIIGVSSGAAFGGALAILLFESAVLTVLLAFVSGLLSIFIVYLLSRISGRAPVLLLVLAGVITGAFFSALISMIKFVADPDNKLPAIVYWLMGSLASIGWTHVAILIVPAGLSGLLIFLLRFRINILSLGEEEAQSLGVPVERTRWTILAAVAMISAAVVSVAGVVGWVGLVVPHLARMLVGPNHTVLLPAAAAVGALYLLLIDNIARTATAAEIPLGIITAVIGAPVFAVLLRRAYAGGWRND